MAKTTDKQQERSMKIYATEKLRDIRDFVNQNHIMKEDILSIQKSEDGNYQLIYFVSE